MRLKPWASNMPNSSSLPPVADVEVVASHPLQTVVEGFHRPDETRRKRKADEHGRAEHRQYGQDDLKAAQKVGVVGIVLLHAENQVVDVAHRVRPRRGSPKAPSPARRPRRRPSYCRTSGRMVLPPLGAQFLQAPLLTSSLRAAPGAGRVAPADVGQHLFEAPFRRRWPPEPKADHALSTPGP